MFIEMNDNRTEGMSSVCAEVFEFLGSCKNDRYPLTYLVDLQNKH